MHSHIAYIHPIVSVVQFNCAIPSCRNLGENLHAFSIRSRFNVNICFYGQATLQTYWCLHKSLNTNICISNQLQMHPLQIAEAPASLFIILCWSRFRFVQLQGQWAAKCKKPNRDRSRWHYKVYYILTLLLFHFFYSIKSSMYHYFSFYK